MTNKQQLAKQICELCANQQVQQKAVKKTFDTYVQQGLTTTADVAALMEKIEESGFYARMDDITETVMAENYTEEELSALLEMYGKCPGIISKLPQVSAEINICVQQAAAELNLD
jgi:hypothetical protein